MHYPSYKRFWRLFFLAIALFLGWGEGGWAWYRRRFFLPPAPPESARTESHFIALVFPKITGSPERFTLGRDEFEGILRGLRSLGYTPIGLDDVRDFYAEHRLLPTRSVLIAFDRDEPASVHLADRSLKRLRMRGTVF